MRKAPSKRRARNGFSLLELIVATALMGMAVVGLLSLVTGSLSNAAQVAQYDRAAMLARSKMNELLTVSPLPLGERLAGQFDAKTGWEARIEPFEFVGGPRPGEMMLARVKLVIWWNLDGRRRSVEMEGYRPMLIRPEHVPLLPGAESSRALAR